MHILTIQFPWFDFIDVYVFNIETWTRTLIFWDQITIYQFFIARVKLKTQRNINTLRIMKRREGCKFGHHFFLSRSSTKQSTERKKRKENEKVIESNREREREGLCVKCGLTIQWIYRGELSNTQSSTIWVWKTAHKLLHSVFKVKGRR